MIAYVHAKISFKIEGYKYTVGCIIMQVLFFGKKLDGLIFKLVPSFPYLGTVRTSQFHFSLLTFN